MTVRTAHLAVAFAMSLVVSKPAYAECKVTKFIDLAVTMDDMRPMVEAKINGTPGRFIIDSGAWYSVMPTSTAQAAALTLRDLPGRFTISGLGGEADARVATVKEFTLAGVKIPNLEFVVASTNLGTSGVIGQNVLGIGDVEYDLPDGFIRLMKSQGCGHTNLAYWSKDGFWGLKIEPRDRHGNHTFGNITIDGARVGAVFDTGAPTSILSLQAAARAGVKPGDAGIVPAGAVGGFGRKVVQTWIAPFKVIKIGDEEIHNAKLRIGGIDLGDADMLIGADFFISHRIYVSNSLNMMFFTYTGGNIFDIKAHEQGRQQAGPQFDETQAPKTAEEFSRRGAVFANQHDPVRAITDFTHAIELAPREAHYLVQRAEAHLANRNTEQGRADLDRAIALDPANIEALLDRARLFLVDKRPEKAFADIDAAARAAVGPADIRLQIAQLYEFADADDRAIAQYDLWMPAHRDDSRMAGALNSRCWIRALQGKDLDKALDDCNEANRRFPRTAAFLDSRGMVHLRRGEFDKAIADYDAALKLRPDIAWSLYGRGLAKRHKGLTAQGDADIAAAVKINPDVAEEAKKRGIS